MKAAIRWLRTPEGEAWAHNRISSLNDDGGNPARHSHGLFASVKYDHEGCTFDPVTGMFRDCCPAVGAFSYTDHQITEEMKTYGMNGVPHGEHHTTHAAAAC